MKLPFSGAGGSGGYGYSESPFDDDDDVDRSDETTETPDNDFNEYLWMENEEEFDKLEWQRLEEEELMEQCIENMMEDENDENELANECAGTIMWSTQPG